MEGREPTSGGPPAPAAPPTSPGAMPAGFDAPTSGMAVTATVFAVAGLIVPGAGIVAIVLGVLALRRLRRDGARLRGRSFALVGLWVGVGGFVISTLFTTVMLWGVAATVSTARSMERGQALMRLRSMATSWAQSSGEYPDHIARVLLPETGQSPASLRRLVLDQSSSRSPTPRGQLVVGGFDLADLDGGDASLEALRDALDGIDVAAPWYRFGDTYFVRLPRPAGDGSRVFAWRYDEHNGTVIAVMDDGTMRATMSPELFWADHLAALQEVLPRFEPPAGPGDAPD